MQGKLRISILFSREVNTMNSEPVAPATKGVTVQLLATVDLGPEIEGLAER